MGERTQGADEAPALARKDPPPVGFGGITAQQLDRYQTRNPMAAGDANGRSGSVVLLLSHLIQISANLDEELHRLKSKLCQLSGEWEKEISTAEQGPRDANDATPSLQKLDCALGRLGGQVERLKHLADRVQEL